MAVLTMLLEHDGLHVEATRIRLMARAALEILLRIAAARDCLSDMTKVTKFEARDLDEIVCDID